MKTMKHTGKKALSVFLAVLMVMTAWVFVAPTEAEAVASNVRGVPAIKGSHYAGSTGAYGMELFDGNLERWFKFHNNNADYVTISYPSHIYLDKSETLQSAGYFFNVDWHFGHSTDYRILIGANALGDNSQWSGKPDNYYTMTNMFNNYGFDASVPYGVSNSWVYGQDMTDGNSHNLRIVGYGHSTQGTDQFSYLSFTHTKYVLFKSQPINDPNQATIYLMGTPKNAGTGTYSTSGYDFKEDNISYGYQQNWNKKWVENSNSMFHQKGYGNGDTKSSNYNPDGWPEMEWNVIIYDKSALNSEINTSATINNGDGRYTTSSWNSFQSALTNARNTLAKREVTQNDIDSVYTTLYNARTGLTLNTYRITWIKKDGTTAGTVTKSWNSAVDCAALSAQYPNTIAPIANNDGEHQTYIWDTSNYVSNLKADIVIYETPSGKVAHTYDSYTQNADNHQRTCSVCGYVQTQAHIKGTGYVTKAETCTEDGVMTYDCSTCGKKAIETSVINNITGHDFSGTPIENVTGENGNHWKKCSRCDVYGWGTTANACENHNWDKNSDGQVNASDADTKASTCKEAGYEKYTCKVCNATWTKTLDLAAHKTTATAAKDVTNVCGGDGNAAFWKCSVCNRVWKDAALTDEVTDLTDADGDNIPDVLETKGPDHEFTGAYVNVSNGADGTHYRQCSRFTQCGKYGLMVNGVAVVGATEAHKFTSTETASSCTVQGTKTYTCSDCKHSYTEKLPLAAHSMTKIAAVAAECGKAGNNEYYSCSTCSRYYKDANGTTVTTVEAEKIAALEHKWTAHHDYDTLKTAATCQSAAVYNNHCDYCKVPLAGASHDYGSPDTANGHKFDGDIVDLKNGKHAYKCTVEGCTAYGNSTDCNYKVTADVASTCKTAGYTTYICETCGNGKSDTKPLDPTNHTGEGTKTVGALDAKCHTNGYTGDTHCLGCDALLEKGKTIEADPKVHPHEDMKDYEAQASTCQTEGWKAYKYCSACGTYEIEKVEVEKKAHKFTTYTSNGNGTHTATCDTCKPDVATPVTDTKNCSGGVATCVDKKVCAVCKTAYGEVDSANHKEIVTKAKVPSTCQTEGTEAYRYCEACNTALEKIVKIEKLDHKYGDWSKIAGEDKHTRSCTTCNPAVAAVATETADCNGGTAYCNKLAKCKDCKAEYGDFDPANHSTEANTLKDAVAATCQKEGFSGNYHYDCCNAIKEAGEETPKLDHSFTELVSRELATCIKEGSETYKCSTCVESVAEPATNTTVLPINAKNHASTETKTVGYIAATCKDDGYTGDKYYTCCYDETKTAEENKKALKEKGTVIKADGDNHTVLKDFAAVPATCQKAGNYAYSYCSTCGTYMMNGENVTKDQTVEAKIAHTFTKYDSNGDGTHTATCDTCKAADGEVAKDTKNCSGGSANCKDKAVCTVCKEAYGKVDATTHKTVKNFAKVDSTCQTEGYEAYQYCEACGKNITEMKIISKKAHKFGEWTPVDGKDEHTRSCTTCVDTDELDIATETEACKGGTATCKNKAKCSVCGDEYGALNPNNHISDNVVTEERVEATCQQDGWTGREYYKCCYVAGADNTDALKNPGTKLPKVAHKYVEVEGTRVPATCLTKGSVSYECSTCDPAVEAVATKVEVLKEDKNNHASEEILTLNAVEATCSTDGYSVDKYHACCYESNKTTSLIQKGYKIPATGDHKLINPVPEYLVEYTETDGVITGYTAKADTLTYEEKIEFRDADDNKWYHVQICEDCGKIVKGACFTYEHTSTCTTTDICEICKGLCSLVNPKNHAGKLILIPAVPATGNTPGTIAHYKCEACGKLFFDEAGQEQVVNLKDLEIEVTIEHEIKEGVPAVPGENGTHKYECEHCEEFIVEDCSGGTATCQSKAKCSICGQEYGEIDAKNHITDEVVIVGKKDATCSDSGYTGDAYYKCCYVEGADNNSKALKAEGKVIPNDPSLHVMKLRDNLNGTHTEYCEGCGTYELAPVAHIWVAGKVPETASCTEGYDLGYTCICGATKTEHVDAKGHDYAETVKENPADCTTEGEKIITKTCKVCGATETVTETIAALGHDKRTIKGVPATCSTNGSTDYIYCNRCDTVLQDTTVIPATGCEDKNNDGFCDSCGDYLRINEDGTNCNCICHKKNVFMKLLYKFLNFFWKLFKIEKTCGCGAVQHW